MASYWASTTNSTTLGGWQDQQLIWAQWNAQASTLLTQQVWAQWVGTTLGGIGQSQTCMQPPPRTVSEAEARRLAEYQRAENARQMELQAKIAAEHMAANERAAKLLDENLTEEERKTWKKDNVIEITSQRGKRFRIKRGISGNVVEFNDKKIVATYCCHPDNVPTDDVVLTQLLTLKYDEDHFRAKANRTAA